MAEWRSDSGFCDSGNSSGSFAFSQLSPVHLWPGFHISAAFVMQSQTRSWINIQEAERSGRNVAIDAASLEGATWKYIEINGERKSRDWSPLARFFGIIRASPGTAYLLLKWMAAFVLFASPGSKPLPLPRLAQWLHGKRSPIPSAREGKCEAPVFTYSLAAAPARSEPECRPHLFFRESVPEKHAGASLGIGSLSPVRGSGSEFPEEIEESTTLLFIKRERVFHFN